MLVDARVPKTMSLCRVELDLMRLIEPNQICCQCLGVSEMHILINQTVRDKQSIFTTQFNQQAELEKTQQNIRANEYHIPLRLTCLETH